VETFAATPVVKPVEMLAAALIIYSLSEPRDEPSKTAKTRFSMPEN
jgi:hypothetical protein